MFSIRLIETILRLVYPLQSPHAVTHLSPCFWQEHKLVPQGFFDRTNFSTVSSAAAMSVIIRDRIVPSDSSVQTQCKHNLLPEDDLQMSPQAMIMCCSLCIGGSFCGSISLLDETMFMNSTYREKFKESSCLPP